MRPCPHCGQPVAAEKAICPNCGTSVPAVWPPPPEGSSLPEPAVDDMQVRREVNAGTSTGCAGQFALWAVTLVLAATAVGRLVSVLLQRLPAALQLRLDEALLFLPAIGGMTTIYFIVQQRRPHFARGLGYSILVGLALSLGLIAICGPQ